MHIVTSGPALADFGNHPIKSRLWEDEVEEREASVDFDGKEAIGRGEVAASSHPLHFSEEGELLGMLSYMFDHGIGVGNIKRVVSEGELCTIGGQGFDLWIALMKFGPVGFEPDGSDISRIAVESFEEIVVV